MQILKNIWNDFSNQIKFSKLFKDRWKEIFYEKYYEKLIDYISSW